ncbi:hypothetical protein COY28_03065 [Candidatus Woesearchaeota archaeon CG_4_10_14_0_2_um_filter_57_5]|nr:MAG: hypothetical protein AUJ68_02760 [Candidatus Woesearchaeota archaeon CG1_02_57_44]PIZ53999.1 MAG: hypothetical protein COY28_03065 [Candidatus Woesearchaeota archaeon CG_4_10_14_0_2_um_filter_57_5]
MMGYIANRFRLWTPDFLSRSLAVRDRRRVMHVDSMTDVLLHDNEAIKQAINDGNVQETTRAIHRRHERLKRLEHDMNIVMQDGAREMHNIEGHINTLSVKLAALEQDTARAEPANSRQAKEAVTLVRQAHATTNQAMATLRDFAAKAYIDVKDSLSKQGVAHLSEGVNMGELQTVRDLAGAEYNIGKNMRVISRLSHKIEKVIKHVESGLHPISDQTLQELRRLVEELRQEAELILRSSKEIWHAEFDAVVVEAYLIHDEVRRDEQILAQLEKEGFPAEHMKTVVAEVSKARHDERDMQTHILSLFETEMQLTHRAKAA